MTILITGSVGFIGHALSLKLLKEGYTIIGVDNENKYYDVNLKKSRLKILKKYKKYFHHKINIHDYSNLFKIFKKYEIKIVINLAAQAGVRHSFKAPKDYVDSNLLGFFNIIDISTKFKIKMFLYASSSSVYGNQNEFPIKENAKINRPLSLYAASKMSNELIAHSYSNIYNLNTIGLRFFTVYGPYGRPDMSLFHFTKSILENKNIELFNYGNHFRDFTYIDDVVRAIKLIIKKKDNKSNFRVFNVARGKSIPLINFVKEIEKNLNKKALVKNIPLQKGDVKKTHADISKLINFVGYKPQISYQDGVKNFVDWYLDFYEKK